MSPSEIPKVVMTKCQDTKVLIIGNTTIAIKQIFSYQKTKVFTRINTKSKWLNIKKLYLN